MAGDFLNAELYKSAKSIVDITRSLHDAPFIDRRAMFKSLCLYLYAPHAKPEANTITFLKNDARRRVSISAIVIKRRKMLEL